ncbi:MAG: glycoside hydrolase family 2, partial [Muribaculaceae bacterium]|nr:glycoside hydrolase family 2 [Muribaculaceae bacterium]
PFEPGRLTVEGCDKDGNVMADYTIASSGRPYSLRVTSDTDRIDTSSPIAHLTVEVLDEEGNVVKLADNEISCHVSGPARLLGLEGSNNSDMSDYTDNRHRAYHGRLLAYIESTGKEEPVTISFSSPLLKGTQIILNK